MSQENETSTASPSSLPGQMLPEPKAPETPSSFKSIPLSRDLIAWRYPRTT
jgi:hypothetical protein